jgi:hypothetical protein
MRNDDSPFECDPEQVKNNGDADTSPSTVEFLPQQNRNRDGRPPSQRYIPLEADEALTEKIENDLTMTGEHTVTLNELLLAYRHDEAKYRLFGIKTPDQHVHDLIDRQLGVAIQEMQQENATVCGVVYRLVQTAVNVVYLKHVIAPQLHHDRSADEIRAEIECVSKTLERLQKELA